MKTTIFEAPAIGLATLMLAMLAPSACTSTDPGHDRSVALGAAALRISLPLFLADEGGLFRKHGVAAELRPYDTAQTMIDDLALGRLDAAGFAAWPIVLVASQRAGASLRTVASIVEDHDHRLSYVLRRRGAALRFPADVRGKRIGILPTIAYRRWLEAILRTESIDVDDVTIVPVAPPMQAQSLAEGGVDLLFTGDPMATAMIASGGAEIADDGPPCARRLGDPFEFGTFVIAEALVRERPDLADRLVRSLDEGIEAARADPSAARRALRVALRPAERAWVDRYPATRYRTSSETPADLPQRESRRARQLGILHDDARVSAWRPR